jgi:hypothetical protein
MNGRSRFYRLPEQIARYLTLKYCYRYQQQHAGPYGIPLRFGKDEIQVRPINLCLM